MKNTLILSLILILNWSCTKKTPEIPVYNSEWNVQKRIQYLEHRSNPTTWDEEMLQSDQAFIGIGDLGPFEIGVFPVPKYDLLGNNSFKGLGNRSEDFSIGSKNIVMNSFFVNENKLNTSRLNGLKSQVFFHVLVLTDTLDDENYNLNKSIAISRNHPDYLGQGFVKTKKNRIDYVAFQTAENSSFAIINTRLFDLNFGKTILIAPQRDGSLKSLQIESPELTSDLIIDYTEKLIKEPNIISFFNNDKTI